MSKSVEISYTLEDGTVKTYEFGRLAGAGIILGGLGVVGLGMYAVETAWKLAEPLGMLRLIPVGAAAYFVFNHVSFEYRPRN